jgi:hypothetical protein
MTKLRSKISVIPADPRKPRHKKTLFIQAIPDDTHSAFKSACARRGETMRDVAIKLMRKFVADTPV